MKKVVLSIVATVVCVIAAGGLFLTLKGPAMKPAPNIKVAMTPERIERGRYIFENLAHCDGCHSPRDWMALDAPTIAETRGSGATFPAEFEFPGTVTSANITPDKETGLGAWTDGEKIRAIREGVSRDGRALFPFMPYPAYAKMSDEDVEALVAFMNTLKPVRKAQPKTVLNFPVNLLVKFEPKPVEGKVGNPDRNNPLKYGEYLVEMGECMACHTMKERGKNIAGKEYAGGFEFPIAGFLVRSANITPDEETGIGKWSEERFINTFKDRGRVATGSAAKATQATFSPMGWADRSHLEEADLKAIFAYLRTLKPVYHPVEVHPAAAN
jgi:mono/diheme cytochrome c family protein